MPSRIGVAPQPTVLPRRPAEAPEEQPEPPKPEGGWLATAARKTASAGRALSTAAARSQSSIEKSAGWVADSTPRSHTVASFAAGASGGLAGAFTSPASMVGAALQLADAKTRAAAAQTLRQVTAHPLDAVYTMAEAAFEKLKKDPFRAAGEAASMLIPGAAAKGAGAVGAAREASSLLEAIGSLSPRAEALGIRAIHNNWLGQAKAPLGIKSAETPAARAFALPVDVDAKGALVLGKGGQLTDAQRQFVEQLGAQQPGATPATAYTRGSDAILAMIRKNNTGALRESIALAAQHLEGSAPAVLTDPAGYLSRAGALPPPALPSKAVDLTIDGVRTQLKDLRELTIFLTQRGEQGAPRNAVPEHLRSTWDLLARKHDLWVREQLGWGVTSGPDLVPAAQLPANRLALDSAPLFGALRTMMAALDPS